MIKIITSINDASKQSDTNGCGWGGHKIKYGGLWKIDIEKKFAERFVSQFVTFGT